MNGPKKIMLAAAILLAGGGIAFLFRPGANDPKPQAQLPVTVPAAIQSAGSAEDASNNGQPAPDLEAPMREGAGPGGADLSLPFRQQARKPVLSPETYPDTSVKDGPKQIEVMRLPTSPEKRSLDNRSPLSQSTTVGQATPGLAEQPTFRSPAAPGASGSERARSTAAAKDQVVMHVIVDGDSLASLAQRYLGSAARAVELFQYNRDLLSDMDLLPLGKKLRIRGAPAPAQED